MHLPPDMTQWKGRIDDAEGELGKRWHQVVQPFVPGTPGNSGKGVVLAGFACDAGVERNHGRTGARKGPSALRGMLGNMPVHRCKSISDAGVTSIAAELGNFYAGATYFQFLRGVHYPATNAAGIAYRESSITLPVEPRGTHRVDFRNILNLRVEKALRFGGERRLSLVLDVLNTLNSSAVTHIQSSRIEFVNFLLPEAIESPRRARVGIRFAF